MMKYYFIIFTFIFSFSCFSQAVTIAVQDFDETTPEWNFVTDIPFFDNGTDGFFGIHNGDNDSDSNDTGSSDQTTNITNASIVNDFLFINDLSDESDFGTGGEAIITFDTQDINTYNNVFISFHYDIVLFDNTDYIQYQVLEDDLITIKEELPKNQSGTISIPVKNKTNSVIFKFIIKQNGADDFAAIDNIKLEGKPIIPCNDLLISEYIEGTSSGSFRNNFIEIYNPTSNPIDLNTYDLVKYTGKSLVVSNTLPLAGSIPAYGVLLLEDVTENLGINANISTNNAVMDFTGDDKIALRNSETIIDLIGEIGDSVNFAKDVTLRRKSHIQSPNNQYNSNEWDVYALENIKDIKQHISSCSGAIPEIEVSGNYYTIVDQTATTTTTNHTFFGATNVNSEEIIPRVFTIKNTGNSDLNISGIEIIGTNASDFTLENNIITTIFPNDSISFTIDFQSNSQGLKSAMATINSNDASENPFQFAIQGEVTGTTESPLLISQYYEGDGNNKWLEITNISENATSPNFYYLALFSNEKAENPTGENPNVKITLPVLLPGEIVIYKSTLSPTQPAYALNSGEIATQICRFNGDDIVVISTANDATCWENKIDLIGNSSNWGENKSFVRKYGCKASLPNTGFSESDWLVFETSEIDNAAVGYNYFLGQHFTGNTIFENTNTWNNGFPDIYRDVIINSDYNTGILSDIEACNLTINQGKTLEIESNQYGTIQSDVIVHGTLNVLQEGSLLMLDNDGLIVNNGAITIHKTTTQLKQHDYTYWSSPAKTASLETVFHASPQNSFYTFYTQNYSDLNEDGLDDDENAWVRASGGMIAGKGYTAMAPNTNPFIETQSVIFTGEVNNGFVHVPVYESADLANTTDDFNLIGNPYPSGIDARLFLNHPDNENVIGGTIYLWTHNTAANQSLYSSDDYAAFTVGTGGIVAVSQGEIPTGTIASGQGFFVEAIQDGTLTFSNEMRTKTGNDNFFKENTSKKQPTENETKIWLNLYNDEGVFNQILIGFLEEATQAVEQKFDGLRFDGNNFFSFYSIAENQNLAIQGTKPWQADAVIPLGYTSKIKNKITLKIGIDHLEGEIVDQEVYLQDNLLHKLHNLKVEDYTFETELEGNFDDRFTLQFNQQVLNNTGFISRKNTLIVKNEGDFICIATSENNDIDLVKIYDILGRKILVQNVHKREIRISKNTFHSKGMYILQVQLENNQVLIQKIIP